MRAGKTPFFLLILFALLALTQFSTSAQAATAPDWQNADCSQLNQTLQGNETERAQKLVQSNSDYWRYLPPIDLATYNCLNQLETALDQLQAISNFGLGAIIEAAANQILASVINQACSAVVGTFTGATNFAYSQLNRFCIPLPQVNLNLHAASFPAGPACNGTPLFHTTPMPANTASAPSLWTLWGKRPGESSVKP